MAKSIGNRRCFGLFVAGLLVAAGSGVAAESRNREGVFIHVTHGTEDPHRVLMALAMADIMADGRDVLVYFDIEGVQVVLANAQELRYKHFSSSKEQLKSLPKKGVTLVVCPGCLKAAGKTEKDLAPGIQIADKDRFFSFTQGRILTLDY